MPLELNKITDREVLKEQVYSSLKEAIAATDVYIPEIDLRLDERMLAKQLGVSRTPIRESLIRLENEGFVRTIPHRGAFIIRRTLNEILNMVYVWAGLEATAVRLLVERASTAEISRLRQQFATVDGTTAQAHIDEYSETNISFHRTIIEMSKCQPLIELSENLFLQLKNIRLKSFSDSARVEHSVIDHIHIIEALENRDADAADKLVRKHTLRLGKHIQDNLDYIPKE